MNEKSSITEIRERFDADVERFSKLETGQQAVIDAPLMLDLLSAAAAASNPEAKKMLDIGCGAGNQTLKLLELLPGLDCELLDLSQPMLVRAEQRVSAVTSGKVKTIQSDIRDVDLEEGSFDIILAGAVLHHLRDEEDWEKAFRKIYGLLAPGGGLWISDMVFHDDPAIQRLMWSRYGYYLVGLGGEEYRDKVFAYIEKEDSPRSLDFQLSLLKKVGFEQVEVLHKNSCFAAFGAKKERLISPSF